MSSKFSVRLSLESLDGRIVPDATPVTLPNPDPLVTLTPNTSVPPTPGELIPVNTAPAAPPPRGLAEIDADIASVTAALEQLKKQREALRAEIEQLTNGPLEAAYDALAALRSAYETARDEDKPALDYQINQTQDMIAALNATITAKESADRRLSDNQTGLINMLRDLVAERGRLLPPTPAPQQN